MNYTQAQIDRANAVSLEDFLRTQGETLIKSGREYRWKEHDSLTVRGNKWFRHSQSKGGYPIDFVMEFYGKSFPEAVQMLTGESGEGQTEATTAPPTAFHLPLHNRTADRVIQYLCESRGLNKTLVEAFLLSGDIYEDAKRHNVVFVGRDRNDTPRYAHVRGTADPFRQDIAGSDKSYPFRYEGNGNQLFVFEAPIDLLSFICLYPQDWQTRSYLALGGVSGKALDRFLSERKDTQKVFLCLDSDTAGSEACTRLAQSIPSEIAVIRLVPARKDWNDVLRQQGDIPSRKFIAETITLRELPTAQPVPMLRMADVELTSVEWLWFPYIPFGKLTIIQGNPGEGKTYAAKEAALQAEIDNIESSHPGYDEYRYDLDMIGHDPHELAAYLSAVLQGYTRASAQAELEHIFAAQYLLTLTEEVEVRYRTETRTDSEGNEYDVEVPYNYYILNVTLTSKPISSVASELLTPDQLEMYQVYRQTLGNKPLIFGGGSADTSDSESLAGVEFVNGTRPGNQAVVDIAKSQVGNVGGQPYWSWYGFTSRVEWCACFVSWCYGQMGLTEPRFSACQSQGIPWFQSHGQWGGRDYANIAPGDAIFFDWDLDGSADHVGIVVGTDGSRVYTVEGNSGDACKIKSYSLDL